MQKSPLFGRRIHIAGSIDEDLQIASKAEVENARAFVKDLVSALVAKGATFVVPVDAEKLRSDGMPICFDWLIWEALSSSLVRRPTGAPNPIAIAVQHHKTEDQVPSRLVEVAKLENLSFTKTLTLLDMRLQIIAHRSASKSESLEDFDWRGFYNSVKDYI